MVLESTAFPKPEGVATLEEARQIIATLLARIEHLESRLSKNSRNSSKPPSSDGYDKPQPKSRRTKSDRPSGGQPGHKGNTLKAVEHPDETEVLALQSCPRCGHALTGQDVTGHVRRQVFDIPPPRLQVKEYRAEIKDCPCCKTVVKAEFPAGVTQAVQYGPCLRAGVVYLSHYQLLPYQRLQALLGDLFNAPLSQGTIDTILHRCHDHLEPHEAAVKAQLTRSPVAHFDETGMRMDKVKQKISGCFRSLKGAQIFARVRGYVSTSRKNSLNVFDSIVMAVKGQPFIPGSK